MVTSSAGRVALVTGGTRGIGAGIVRRLRAEGWLVETCGRTAAADQDGVGFTACDVREPTQVDTWIADVAARLGRIDLVVNNAGGSPQALALEAGPRFSERIVQLNLLAPLHVAKAAYPYLKVTGGSVVNIASVSATRPSPATAIYGAAKAGLLSLTGSLAQEWGPQVRVNAVVVGLIETEDAARTYGSAAARDAIAASLPMHRMGRPDDVAGAVVFLASPDAAYVSGATIEVHGGGERPLFLELVRQNATV